MSEGGSKVDTVYKVVLVGHKKSAKRSAIIALEGPDNEQVTVGVSCTRYTLQVRDKNVQLHFWDTAGGKRYLSLIGVYLRESHVVLLCFSTYAPETIQALKDWVPSVREEVPDALAVLVAICSSSHMDQEEVVEMEARGYGIMTDSEIEALAQELGLSKWFSVDAETKAGAPELLSFIGESCLSRYGIIPPGSSQDKKKGCNVA